MITVKEARGRILKSIIPLDTEKVGLLHGLDRVLASDIRAELNLPSFDNSAMDGYALRFSDTKGADEKNPKILEVIEDIPAGKMPSKKVRPGQCSRIMTGAPLPRGTDSVVMVEFTLKIEPGQGATRECISVLKEIEKGENVRCAGEDVKKGEKVLARGCLLRPPELGMLAALGQDKVEVGRRPRVGILATGDELSGFEEKLRPGKIRDSNSFILQGQIRKCGGVPLELGLARDNWQDVEKKIKIGLEKNPDTLLVLGGISVGKYDLVKDVLFSLGMKMEFWRVAMRPGKPLAFGFIKGIPVFGLPGNPVSSTITFEEFVRPALLKMQGARDLFRPTVEAILAEGFSKKKGLRYFVRARIEMKNGKFFARLTGPQGSGIIHSLVLADGIIVVPEQIVRLKKGQTVSVQLLRHGYDGGVF
jgi:molybdopterin molybdotransferase